MRWLCSPVGCSPPGSTVHGMLQARILEWVAVSYLRGSFWSRHWTWVSCIGKWALYHWAAWEAHLYHGNQQTPQSGLLNGYQHTAGYAALAPGILLGSWELELALTGIGVDRTTPIWARAPELACLLSGSFSLAVLRFSCSQIPLTHIADHCFLPRRYNRRFYDLVYPHPLEFGVTAICCHLALLQIFMRFWFFPTCFYAGIQKFKDNATTIFPESTS